MLIHGAIAAVIVAVIGGVRAVPRGCPKSVMGDVVGEVCGQENTLDSRGFGAISIKKRADPTYSWGYI